MAANAWSGKYRVSLATQQLMKVADMIDRSTNISGRSCEIVRLRSDVHGAAQGRNRIFHRRLAATSIEVTEENRCTILKSRTVIVSFYSRFTSDDIEPLSFPVQTAN